MNNHPSRRRPVVTVVLVIFGLIAALQVLFAILPSLMQPEDMRSDLFEDVLPVVQGTPSVRSIEPVYVTEYQEFYEIELTLENTGWHSDRLYDYNFRCVPLEGDKDSMYIVDPAEVTDLSDDARDYLPTGRAVPCRLVLVAPLGSSGTEVQLQYETFNDDLLDLCTIQLP